MIHADDEPTDDPLLDLFRADVREAVSGLSHGLLALESDPTASEPLANLAAAVRTVRGAARIVNLKPAADLAAALEDRIAAAAGGTRSLTRAEVSAFQTAVDLLAKLDGLPPSEWAENQAGEVAAAVDAIRGIPAPAAIPAPALAAIPKPTPAAIAPVEPVEHEPLPHVDPAMLELFREEVRSHAATLSAGLLDLERDAGNPQRIEPLMRAAHSIKGACRIVGLDAAVKLAHEMEDGFVAAQVGKVAITPAAVDLLLKATDLLANLGTEEPAVWLAAHGHAVAAIRPAVAAFARGEAVAAAETPVAATISPTVEPPIAAAPAATVTASSPEPAEAVVRVTAQNLNRLMGLAGESLVQARWLAPFATALLELKKLQDHLAHRLDTAGQGLASTPASDPTRAAVAAAAGLAARCRFVLAERISEFEDHAAAAEDLNTRLYREVIVSRMRPFADGTHGLPRLARDTARTLGKSAKLDVVGLATEVDRDILEKLEAPLTHLVRNAIDHGLEPTDVRTAAGKPAEGTVRIEARHRGGMLSITVADDGYGIDVEKLRTKVVERKHATAEMAARMTDAELLEFLFLPGFSTAKAVTEVSGRGVGLDVVHDTARRVGGSVQVTTALGRGTAFHLLLPLTLSVVRAVLVEIAGEPYAFPHTRIDRLLRVRRSEISAVQHRQFVNVDGQNVGLVLASQILDLDAPPPGGDEVPVVLLSDVSGSYGLVVDGFRGEQDLVVRPLDARLGKVPNVSAAAILDDGSPVLIADVEDLIRGMDQFIQAGTLRRCEPQAFGPRTKKRVLVVDDSITVREVQKQILRSRGYDVEVAVDGQDGWNKVRVGQFDLVVSDVDMPRMTGLEFLRKVREDSGLRDLPVVIVSYKDRDEDRLRGLEAGANQYLTKASFHDESFADAVAGLIGPA